MFVEYSKDENLFVGSSIDNILIIIRTSIRLVRLCFFAKKMVLYIFFCGYPFLSIFIIKMVINIFVDVGPCGEPKLTLRINL